VKRSGERTVSRQALLELAWLAGAALAGTRAARAEAESGPFNVAVTVASDYVFRGFSQTNGSPALQAGLDYSTPVGLVLGTWASNVDFVDAGAPPDGADVEVDLYLMHGWKLGERVSLDTTLIRYAYPGTVPGIDYDYNELVLALHSGDVATFTLAYSNNAFASGEPAILYEFAASYPLSRSLELSTRLGYYDLDRAFGAAYAYYGLGLSWGFDSFTLGARYEGTNDAGKRLWGNDAEGRVIFELSARF
jgi:uncharacterized protein (TIGR02001 family)